MSLPRLFAAVPTPLDDQLHVSVEPLARHCAKLFSQGCDGIVLFGTTGEGTFFSPGEKLSALRRLIAGGIDPGRVILASGACALDDTVTMITGARAAGCLASLVLPPFFTKQIDDEGLAEWFETLIRRSGNDPSIFLYHIPAVAGVGFSPDLASRLLERRDGAVRGVKDSSPDSSLARTLSKRKHSGVYVSTEVGLAGNLAAGIAGTISASLNITLPLVRRAISSDGRDADVRVAAIRDHLSRHSFVWATKTALYAEYGDSQWLRLAPPHRGADGPMREQFIAQLRALTESGPQ